MINPYANGTFNETLKNRIAAVQNMAQNGYSEENIARFFECPIRGVKKILEEAGLTADSVGKSREEMNYCIQARNKMLDSKIKIRGEVSSVLISFGFFTYPGKSDIARQIAEVNFGMENSHPIYQAYFENRPLDEIKGQFGAHSKADLEKMGFDYKSVIKRGKKYRMILSHKEEWELFASNRKPEEVSRILEIPIKDAAYSSGLYHDYFSEEKYNEEQTVKWLKEGISAQLIHDHIGISFFYLTKMFEKYQIKDTENPLKHRTENRRKQVFEMYSVQKMTQQEIADELGLSRATVVSDIQTYKKDHPEQVDKTYLWRQKNSNKQKTYIRNSRKACCISMFLEGKKLSEIAKLTKVKESRILQFLREGGIDARTNGEIIREKMDAMVYNLITSGISEREIADTMGLSLVEVEEICIRCIQKEKIQMRRAEEMSMSWKGMPTTDIMGVVGKSRTTVLKDQHITSDYLRNNQDALEYVTMKNGDVSDHFKKKENIEKEER